MGDCSLGGFALRGPRSVHSRAMKPVLRRLSREEARRIAVRAQLLDAQRPRELAAVVERLTFLQLDPTAAVAPSADLVAWSRLGDRYAPEHLSRALEGDRTLFEHRHEGVAVVRPMADLGLYLAEMTAGTDVHPVHQRWLRVNEAFHRAVIDLLRASGPLASRDIPDTCAVPWQSTGWTNDRNVTRMVEGLAKRGEIAVAGRRGRERVWDLAERVFPPNVAIVPAEEARRIRDERWLRALGVARPKFVGEAGVPVAIEGTRGAWRLDPEATAEGFAGRTALLSPFDRLSHDRVRALDLFGFDYTLDMYKPKANRKWGFFALPILHLDALVGKLDATADREAGVLRVDALHEDAPFVRPEDDAVRAEIDALAAWLGLSGVRYH